MGGGSSRRKTSIIVQSPSSSPTTTKGSKEITSTLLQNQSTTEGSKEITSTLLQNQSTTRGSTASSTVPKTIIETKIDKVCIILSVDDYSNSSLPSLNYAKSDAIGFATLLQSSGYEIIHCSTLATVDDFHQSFNALYKRFEKRTVAQFIFYYAGHCVAPRKKGWFALKNWDANNPYSTGIAFSDITKFANNLGAIQQLWILDSCLSGKALFDNTRGDNEKRKVETTSAAYEWAKTMQQQSAVYIMTACNSMESALEGNYGIRSLNGNSVGGGLFTSVLVEGLQNPNLLTATELISFCQKRGFKLSNGKMSPCGGKLILKTALEDNSGEFILSCGLMALKEKIKNTTPIRSLSKRLSISKLIVHSDPVRRRSENIQNQRHRHRTESDLPTMH